MEKRHCCCQTAYLFFHRDIYIFFCVWQASKRLWTCLCGNALYFFNNAKDTHVSFRSFMFQFRCIVAWSHINMEHLCVFMLQYVEKLDLSGFVSLKDDCSRDRNLEAARLILRMKDGETKLTVNATQNAHTCIQSNTFFFCKEFQVWSSFSRHPT